MKISKPLLVCLVLSVLLLPATTFSQTASLELSISDIHLAAKIDTRFFLPNPCLYVGASALDKDHEYELYDINISVRDNVISPILTAGLGIKEILGDMDIKGKDYDLIASPIFLIGGIDFRKHYYNIPISLTAEASLAPSVMCHQNAESYNDYQASLQYHFSYHLAIVGKYKYMEVDIKKGGLKRSYKEDFGLVGIKVYY